MHVPRTHRPSCRGAGRGPANVPPFPKAKPKNRRSARSRRRPFRPRQHRPTPSVPRCENCKIRPPEQWPRRAFLSLLRNRRFADMVLGQAGSAASSRNAALRSDCSRAAQNHLLRTGVVAPPPGRLPVLAFSFRGMGTLGRLPQTLLRGASPGNSHSRDTSVAPCDFQRFACLFRPLGAAGSGSLNPARGSAP